MSPSDVPPDEMDESRDPLAHALEERALDEDDLASFVGDVRTAFPPAALLAEEAHIEAVSSAARASAPGPAPVNRRSIRVDV